MRSQPTVLVVDDDPNIIAAFRHFLRRERCRMISAKGPEQALGKIGRRRVDLLISDVRIARRSAVAFFGQIKKMKAKLPVILITGYPEAITEKDVKAFGASYLFRKPLEVSTMRDAVRSCLQLSR